MHQCHDVIIWEDYISAVMQFLVWAVHQGGDMCHNQLTVCGKHSGQNLCQQGMSNYSPPCKDAHDQNLYLALTTTICRESMNLCMAGTIPKTFASRACWAGWAFIALARGPACM